MNISNLLIDKKKKQRLDVGLKCEYTHTPLKAVILFRNVEHCGISSIEFPELVGTDSGGETSSEMFNSAE